MNLILIKLNKKRTKEMTKTIFIAVSRMQIRSQLLSYLKAGWTD